MKAMTWMLCGLAFLVGFVAFSWRDTFEPDSLAGARVLLTGASTGIGEQMAYHYSRFGAQLVLTARREAQLRQVAEKCLELGAKRAIYYPADMASAPESEKLVQFALQNLGGLDYVVLNHIGWSPFQMWDGDVDHARWLMQVNFLSFVAVASAALPALTESKGSLVVVSSLAGRVGMPFTGPYSATKFALEGFFASLRNELIMQKKDVSVTVCVLGLIDTESALNRTKLSGLCDRGLGILVPDVSPAAVTGIFRGVTLKDRDLSMPTGIVNREAAPASEAALAIVKGGSTRALEVFYPWTTQLLCGISSWFPAQRDWFIRRNYNYATE